MSIEPAVKIENLEKSFGSAKAVKGISFSIEQGEVFGLLGPNGAGKSTTINMIAGVCNIGSGKISIFGVDVEKEYIEARKVTGVMHQEVALDIFFTIEQALSIQSGYYGVPLDMKWRDTLLDHLMLWPHIKKRPNKLSGGLKRRYMVAKSLIHKPKLLILDEPTAGVDVELRRSLWDFIREINRQGTTVLLTTHYLEEAEAMCGRIAIMNNGEVQALEKKEVLLNMIEGKRLNVYLSRPAPNVSEFLQKFEPSILDNGSTYTFHINAKQSSGEILEGIRESGLGIVDVDTQSGTLEDVFLKITKDKRV